MTAPVLHVGVKSDPIEYRYSFEWLFRIMSEEGVRYVQLGSFFELYQLPDRYFHGLREHAERWKIAIASIFTSHRELGCLMSLDPDWQEVGLKNYKRLIEIGRIVGARSLGSNPGAVLRDRMQEKAAALAVYMRHMKETLMPYAYEYGIERLTIEPMSCLAEPPTLPEEMRAMGEELIAHHSANRETAAIGYCVDVAHGYADENGRVVLSPLDLVAAALPYTTELHLKNTDARFESTFGFSEADRARGIVDVGEVVATLKRGADQLPVRELVGYIEISGPKLGRDYSDWKLEGELRESLKYLKAACKSDGADVSHCAAADSPPEPTGSGGATQGSRAQ